MKVGKDFETINVALAGNPNSGKTSIFNFLTGSRQHVGNYPGVTVEKKEGNTVFQGHQLHVVDLPGIYSLTSYSQEEVIARQYLVEDRPDVVVNVVDATNLERNLYLTIQLLEMGVNLIVVLNMMDEVHKQGVVLDVAVLAERLECPVVKTVGTRGEGLEELKETVLKAVAPVKPLPEIVYQAELGDEVRRIVAQLKGFEVPYPLQFAAVKLLENDIEVVARFRRQPGHEALFDQVTRSINRLENLYGYPPEVLIGDRRYGFSSGLIKEITISRPMIDRISLTEKIDSVVTNRIIGIPFFLLTMYLIFWMTFTLGEPAMNWIDSGFNMLAKWIQAGWTTETPWLKSLILDGIIGGVGGVVVFMPNIVLLFLGISFLEDTGYMARVAFIMDRVMHKIGLHGRSFIPLLIGFGCTVPAILATRTIRSEKTRFTTIFILPLMSCGARLPIYMMIIPAFFPSRWQTPILWTIYCIGLVLAFLLSLVLRKSLFRGEAEPFVMELPPYRMPPVRSVLVHMWDKAWMYLKKAGTVILLISIILWGLLYFPKKTTFEVDATGRAGMMTAGEIQAQHQQESLEYSMAGRIGRFIEPVIGTMGFDWKIGTAFIGALAAKEVFVAQLGIVYALGANENVDSLRQTLKSVYNPLIGFCIMLFALIAAPCSATLAASRKEMGSWKWAMLQWGMLTSLGWIITTIVYQTGRFLLH